MDLSTPVLGKLKPFFVMWTIQTLNRREKTAFYSAGKAE